MILLSGLACLLLLLPISSHGQDKATKVLTLTVNSGTVVLSTTSIPNGMVGLPYQITIGATGGLAPYTFGVLSGNLPAGLTLSTGGVISGTPTTTGTSNFTVQVLDAETPAVTATQSYSVTVIPALSITTSTLPAANIGISYATTIVATGGVSPYTFAVTTGSLPAGLTLNPSTGVLSGTPSAAGTFSFTVTVTDAATNVVRLQVKTKIEVVAIPRKGIVA